VARAQALVERLPISIRIEGPAVNWDSHPDRHRLGFGPRGDWLLGYLGGGFTLLCFGGGIPADAVRLLAGDGIACTVVQVGGKPAAGVCPIDDSEGLAAKRYDARQGTCYLLRPDQHVCARWRAFELGAVRAALARATAQVATAAKAAA